MAQTPRSFDVTDPTTALDLVVTLKPGAPGLLADDIGAVVLDRLEDLGVELWRVGAEDAARALETLTNSDAVADISLAPQGTVPDRLGADADSIDVTATPLANTAQTAAPSALAGLADGLAGPIDAPADMPEALPDPFTPMEGVVEGQVVVKLAAGAPKGLAEAFGFTVIDSTDSLGLQLWSVGGQGTAKALEALQNNPFVDYAEPNFDMATADVTPNDPKFGNLWAFDKGDDRDIDMGRAWAHGTGANSGKIVAVIDTGVDYNHPDLDDNMWVNKGEIAGNGKDDDGNGFVDDIYGWDFYNNDSNPMDDHSHGTHVAGTIGAEGNNGLGVVGVGWGTQIMALKAFNANGSGGSYYVTKAMNYAVEMGADISNHSWRTTGFSQALYDSMNAAGKAGHLVVAAAGNDGRNNDATPAYPASFNLDNVIAVAATDKSDGKPSWSNYGATTVDLGAPGVGIVSTMPGGGYGSKNGTSMAAPHVAGAAALLWAQNPDATWAEIKQAILDGVDPVSSMKGKTVTGGRLNVGNSADALGGGSAPAPEPTPEPAPEPAKALDDSITLNEDDAKTVDLRANDSGDSLTVTAAGGASHGTVKVNADNTVTYTPDADYNGSDSFTYTVTAADGSTSQATVDVTVKPVNDPVDAVDDTATTTADTAITVDVLANDSDKDGDALNIWQVGTAANGTVKIKDGSPDQVVYTPDAGFTGTDTFTYSVGDGNGGSRDATVTVTVEAGTTPTPAPEPEPEPTPEPSQPSGDAVAMAEYGRVTGLTDGGKTITLSHSFLNPVVFAMAPSTNGGDPITIRVSDVTANSFRLATQEPEYKDGSHIGEDVSYIVMEAGTWTLADGTRIEVGATTTSKLANKGAWESLDLSGFAKDPALFSQVQTTNDGTYVHTRQDGDRIALEVEEARSAHGAETIGWFAMDKGAGTWGGNAFSVGNSGDTVTHQATNVGFGQDFGALPQLFTAISSYDGADPSNIRYSDLSGSGAKLSVTEEQSKDSETKHTAESVDFFAIEGSGILKAVGDTTGGTDNGATNTAPTARADSATTTEGQAKTINVLGNDSDPDGDVLDVTGAGGASHGSVNVNADDTVTYTPDAGFVGDDSFTYTISDGQGGTDTATVNVSVQTGTDSNGQTGVMGQTGRISGLTDAEQTITLDHTFDNPVVFAMATSFKGSDAVAVRISNVQGNSFSVQLQEPDYLDGGHKGEDVSFIVLEAGSWQLSDGTRLEVGTQSTSKLANKGAWENLDLGGFANDPALFTQVQTTNDGSYVHTRQDGNKFALEVEEANTTHGAETVGWFAIDKGAGSWDGNAFTVGNTGDKVTDSFTGQSFGQSFGALPQLFAAMSGYDGADPSNVRYDNLTKSGVDFMIHEEQSADYETSHTTESVDYFAFDGSGLLTAQSLGLMGVAEAKTEDDMLG